MKQFLAVRQVEPGVLGVCFTETPGPELTDSSGRVSPLYPLRDVDVADHLPADGHLVLLFPRSSRAVLSRLRRGEHAGQIVYASHGLASVVVVLEAGRTPDELLDAVDGLLCAVEIWPLESGRVRQSDVVVRRWVASADEELVLADVESADLPYEVRTEVEQFNLNLKYFWARAAQYCPEYRDLVIWLQQSVADAASSVGSYATASTDPAGLEDPQQHYGRVSLLVEINACLTMLNSQVVGVTAPLAQATYPIGEYSLLGIGSAARAAWRIYAHMSDVFAEAQHLDRLHAMRNGAPFDSGIKPYALNMAAWGDSPLSMETQSPGAEPSPPRRHIVYFSSRWGFHQTVQSVSLSWQCINGSAALDWNLLTLSHEYLHAHLRELLDEVLLVGDAEQLDALVKDFNSGEAKTFGIATRQFLLQQLRWIDHGLQVVAAMEKKQTSGELLRKSPMTSDEALHLLKDRVRFLEEVVVHVMDYIYFYDADDETFVSSLWHSWALVPNVQPKIEEYVLRTLLALASTWRSNDSASDAFADASARLDSCFARILDDGTHGLVSQARTALDDAQTAEAGTRRNLRARFEFSFALVRWTRTFLVSSELHADLARDEQRGVGEPAYPFDPWEFPGEGIESPAGFLLDRFRRMKRAHENDRLEADSLWQLLILI